MFILPISFRVLIATSFYLSNVPYALPKIEPISKAKMSEWDKLLKAKMNQAYTISEMMSNAKVFRDRNFNQFCGTYIAFKRIAKLLLN